MRSQQRRAHCSAAERRVGVDGSSFSEARAAAAGGALTPRSTTAERSAVTFPRSLSVPLSTTGKYLHRNTGPLYSLQITEIDAYWEMLRLERCKSSTTSSQKNSKSFNIPFLLVIGVDTVEIWHSEICQYIHTDPSVGSTALVTLERIQIDPAAGSISAYVRSALALTFFLIFGNFEGPVRGCIDSSSNKNHV